MGLSDFFKKSRKQVIRENQARGKEGEDKVKNFHRFIGNKIERTGRGHDYKITKRNALTGKKETKYIEVKTGNAQLSNLQRKKKSQFGNRYVVERLETNPFGVFIKPTLSNTTSSRQRVPKKPSMLDSLLGIGGSSSKTSRRKSKSKSVNDTFFGSKKSSGRKRSKSSSVNDTFFGSKKSSGRKSSGGIW